MSSVDYAGNDEFASLTDFYGLHDTPGTHQLLCEHSLRLLATTTRSGEFGPVFERHSGFLWVPEEGKEGLPRGCKGYAKELIKAATRYTFLVAQVYYTYCESWAF